MFDNGKRLESVRIVVDEMLNQMTNAIEKRCAYIHLYGVSEFATLLALKRGVNPELAAIAGMLHDYYVYNTNISDFHAHNGAEAVRPIIRDIGIFTIDEQRLILNAIFHHSDKDVINDIYDEIIKDADVLQHYLYDVNKKISAKVAPRLKKILDELLLPCDFLVNEDNYREEKLIKDRRFKLAEIAQELALKNINGIPSDEIYQSICQYWPGNNIYIALRGGWCAAFVYHCCKQAGFLLPIRYPSGTTRFAGVCAWVEWANHFNFFHSNTEKGFTPEKGDIVVFDRLITDKPNDHIGIVLSCDENFLLSAEGNVDNKNQSGVIKRSRIDKVFGYIRIDNDYQYQYRGTFNIK